MSGKPGRGRVTPTLLAMVAEVADEADRDGHVTPAENVMGTFDWSERHARRMMARARAEASRSAKNLEASGQSNEDSP